MPYWLKIDEEIEIKQILENPHFEYGIGTLLEKKKVARIIFLRPEKELLLVDRSGFCENSVFAGLTERHIEYFAKNAPLEYKKELMEIFKEQELINGVWEIVKAMDYDEGDGLTRNQDRTKKVIQYMQDNRAVF